MILLQTVDLRKQFGETKACDGVNFVVNQGEFLSLVGSNGAGKTSLVNLISAQLTPDSGQILFEDADIATFDGRQTQAFRRHVQAVFQDPFSSLNPRMTVEEIVGEPLLVHGFEPDRVGRLQRVRELLSVCGLPARLVDRYPHEMSGGQRQRVGIARALALRPAFIVCDEAVSALDVSIQAQIVRLLEDLRAEFGLTYLFIGHDLSVVRHICQRVAVMYLGRIVEIAEKEALFETPLHPYTQALMAAAPIADPHAKRERMVLQGDVPSPINPPPGCTFHTRCPFAFERCKTETPLLKPAADDGRVARHLVD